MARKCNSTVSTSLINMLLSGSPTTCSSDSSSNLDTQVGSDIYLRAQNTSTNDPVFCLRISNILELPRRSIGRAKTQVLKRKRGKKSKSRSWLFCLCSNSNSGSNPDAENNPPSLGQFLALERRASNENRKNQIISLLIMCPDNELALTQTIEEARSYILFVNGTIDPSQSISSRQNPQREHMQGIRILQNLSFPDSWLMQLRKSLLKANVFKI
ncbi:hypothetical protein GmHk_12G034031 [Glycine max]|nr:hypothetical protein GmHk_12G034031 [Glycine max]